MDYNHVALFVRVVRAGSFTAAAAEVGLPKSSVSRSVTRLEDELGVRLLQRTTRKLALTEVGQHYYDAVSGSVRNIDDADSMAKEHGLEPRGTVRLTAPPELNLASVLIAFRKKYPGILIEVSLTPRRVDLIAEGFDLAIRGGRLEDSSLVMRRIASSRFVLMASPAYLRAQGRPQSVPDLARHEFVLYRAVRGTATLHLHRVREDTGEKEAASVLVRGSLVADDLGLVLDAVVEGAGIGFLPIQAFADRAGELEPVLPGWGDEGLGGIFVVMPTSQYIPARVALLRDFLVEYLGRLHQMAAAECEGRAPTARRPPPGAKARGKEPHLVRRRIDLRDKG
jgi:DNA-binding transcriptional LysR family regulator